MPIGCDGCPLVDTTVEDDDGNEICVLFVGASYYCKQCGAEFAGEINWTPERAVDTVNVVRCENCRWERSKTFEERIRGNYPTKVYCGKNCRWKPKNGFCDEGEKDAENRSDGEERKPGAY